MMTRIVSFSERNPCIGCLLKIVVRLCLHCISVFQTICGFLRTRLPIKTEQCKIKNLEKTYNGQRCFIICTGPSLCVEDLELINNEYTFAMNSIALLFEKTCFRPKFYGCIDSDVFKNIGNETIAELPEDTLVFLSGRTRRLIKEPLRKNWYNVSCNVAYHTYDRWFNNKFWCKFSDDALFGTYDMYSVTHFLIQIAIYMGFKEIYLLGADCNQKRGQNNHFVEYGVVDKSIDTSRERNIRGYVEIYKYCQEKGIGIYNVTRGGELEVFPRKELENVIHS